MVGQSMELRGKLENGISKEMNDPYQEINVPPLPSAFQIIFRCRDCDYEWKLEMDLPASLVMFYRQNAKCYSCKSTNIQMDILPKTENIEKIQ